MKPLGAFDLTTGTGRFKARKAGYPIPLMRQWKGGRYKECAQCSGSFRFFPSSERKFCSYACHLASGGAQRAGFAAAKIIMNKYGAKKDANHHEIIEALEKAGVAVIDMSGHGCGFPDLIVCRRGATLLVEIKNPTTPYGRRGLNKRQSEWADNWPAPVYILKTLEHVRRFVNCEDAGLIRKR